MAHSYMYGGVHPTLMGYARGPGLGAEVPGLMLGPKEGVSVIEAPIIPLAVAGFLGWVGAKQSTALGVVLAFAGYFGARIGLAAAQGRNVSQGL